MKRRGSILIETVIAVVMIALAVPASVAWMQSVAGDRADAANAMRATAMATAVAEHVLADTVSPSAGLGMPALADAAGYLDTPGSGLRARLGPLLSVYTDAGFSFDLEVGGLVGPGGVATGDAMVDVCRRVTVTVRFPGSRGGVIALGIGLLVTGQE
ncbi:MAG: hypothetical protein KF787_03300 [Phycisphaeraceae bacterium]|nr:hypothetical protein [Phycisphaerae bacterium]MBX3391653.1 hypothetical protein [Phycisphaeraceae bacterium]